MTTVDRPSYLGRSCVAGRITLAVTSVLPFERVEFLVNGDVAWSGAGLEKTGTRTYRGTLHAPAGGWIVARVHGGTTSWPAIDSYPFPHTAPLWIGRLGSTDPAAARRAAAELLAALDVAEERVRSAYKEARASQVLDRIALARDKLQGDGAVKPRRRDQNTMHRTLAIEHPEPNLRGRPAFKSTLLASARTDLPGSLARLLRERRLARPTGSVLRPGLEGRQRVGSN